MKSLQFLALTALVAAMLHGQPSTTGTAWWSTTPIDCSSVDNVPVGSSYTISLPSGATGYYCYVSGTFPWLAAGSGYITALRVAAPASGPVGVDYSFYDTGGNSQNLDTTLTGSSPASGNDVNFVLSTNQPAEVNLLGAQGDAPNYSNLKTGSVYAQFYCSKAATCLSVLPQLIYSAAPTISLSVPIAWNGLEWTQWSAEGIDDGGAHRVSLVIYNQATVAAIYTVRVFDSSGAQVGLGTTPAIAGYSSVTGEGGTYGDLLSNIVKTSLPSGILKVLVDGGSNKSTVLMLQGNGRAIATLQVGYDSAPSGGSTSTSALQTSPQRAPSKPRQVSSPSTQ